MKSMLRSGVCAALLFAGQTAFAGPYVAATGAITSTKYNDIKDGLGASLSAGYQLDTSPLFVEASYYNSGRLKIDDYSGPEGSLRGARLSYSGGQAFLGASLPLMGGSRVWIKGGYYLLDGKLRADEVNNGSESVSDPSFSSNSNGFSAGIGLDWMFSRDFGFRADVETPFKVDTTPGLPGGPKSQLSIVRLGFVWRPTLGSSSAPYSPTVRNADAAAPMSAPPPVAAAAPEMAVVFKPGDQALARPGSSLRATPREDSEAVQTLLPSPVLKLESSIVNATGTWWFVSSDIERGWLRADELVSMR